MKKTNKNQKGITLIALVITVIVMLIISAVAISAITDPEGIFRQAREAGENYNTASQNEAEEVTDLIEELKGLTYQDPSGANAPKLLTGMTAVTFNADGTTKEVTDKSKWYNYEEKQWANAETEDGSLWVWIPRFAYKITYTDTTEDPINDPIDKSQGGTIDVVFLNGTTNNYTYETSNGSTAIGTASATHDTSTYTLHPSFKKAVNGDYSHGEWDKELTGYWVAKFEAGWQQGDAVNTDKNNKDNAVESSLAFKNPAGTIYLKNKTNITYPVFKPQTYSMNAISIADSFAICRYLTEIIGTNKNFYGLNASDADSHLMKNSEWGASAYLGYSQYGTNGGEVYINNANMNNSIIGVYAVTGYTATLANEEAKSDLSQLNVWYTAEGQKGSNNHNITGIYDMVGGTKERVSAFIANANENIKTCGIVDINDKLIHASIVETASNNVTTLSTKYSTIYKHNNNDTAGYNYSENTAAYGDATMEISSGGEETTSWNDASSLFVSDATPFFQRGGTCDQTTTAGLFDFAGTFGGVHTRNGFRAVLTPR